MQRHDGDGGRHADVLCLGDERSEQDMRAGVDAKRVEMMLADPGRVHADAVGVQGFFANVENELFRRALDVVVIVVAQCEVAELHDVLPD